MDLDCDGAISHLGTESQTILEIILFESSNDSSDSFYEYWTTLESLQQVVLMVLLHICY